VQAEKIPFIISVTGHRDLSLTELSRCRKKIESILKYFCELKSLKDTPIWVFSSLADGADRCVAEVALALRETGLYEIRVIAPLPLERDVYIQDFSEASAQEFDRLLTLMDDHFVLDPYEYEGFDATQLRLPEVNQRNKENSWGYTPERNAQYVNLGAFLVRHANVLLALWDGNLLANSIGGTSEVVMAMLNQPMDWGTDSQGNNILPREELRERRILMGGESGAVIHLPVRRSHMNESISILQLVNQRPQWAQHWPNDTIKWYFSYGNMYKEGLSGLVHRSQSELRTIIEKISQFNSELSKKTARRKPDDIDRQLKKSWIQPLDHEFSEAVERIRDCYRSADWCALSMQVKATLLIQAFFFSVLMAIIGYDVFSQLESNDNLIRYYSLLLFFIGILSFSLIYFFSRKVRYKRKFHDFRVYAELMRVSSYLSYLGINRKIVELFSPDTRSMTAWLEHARRAAEYQTWNYAYARPQCSTEDMNNIKKWWINDQLDYYAGKLGNEQNEKNFFKKHNLISRQKRIRIISAILYIIGAGITASIAFYYFLGELTAVDYIWLNVVFFGSSAIIAKWGELQGYKEDASRYTMAQDMYQWVELEFDDLLKADDLPRLKNVVLELAKQAILENTRWYISQSSRDVSIGVK